MGLMDRAKDASAHAYQARMMTEADVTKYLIDDEEIADIITQITMHKTKTLVLTNDRVMVFTKELLKRSFEDYYFKDMKDAHFSSDLVRQGAITLTTDRDGAKKVIKVPYLPTDAARAFYIKLQKIEKEWAVKKREHELEDKRAASGASSIVVSAPAAAPVPTAATPAMSIEAKLQKLKSLKAKGLIDEQTYQKKTQQLIDEM